MTQKDLVRFMYNKNKKYISVKYISVNETLIYLNW